MCGSFLLMALYSDLIKYYSIDVEALWEYVPGDYFPNRNAPIVIDDGKILEEGTSEELLKKKGLYYNLYMAQFKNI